jgi:hypothetical protein
MTYYPSYVVQLTFLYYEMPTCTTSILLSIDKRLHAYVPAYYVTLPRVPLWNTITSFKYDHSAGAQAQAYYPELSI